MNRLLSLLVSLVFSIGWLFSIVTSQPTEEQIYFLLGTLGFYIVFQLEELSND